MHGNELANPFIRHPSAAGPSSRGQAPQSLVSKGTVMIAALCFDPLPLYLACRSEPDLVGVPLVHVEEQRVTHANSVAKRNGIGAGMLLEGARMRVEGLKIVSHTEPDLQHAWQDLLRELHQHTPWLESGVRGRVFTRLDPDEAAELGEHYRVRIGLADDCETAELAALASRPGDCKIVADSGSFLTRLPLRFLRGVGVGERNLTRLQWLGLATAGDLAAWTASQVTSYLGAEGERLLPYLHGPRRSTLLPFSLPAVIARSLTFSEPVREPARLLPALDRLAGELEGALSGRVARRLTLTAGLPSGTLRASRLSKRPLTQARHIRQQALFALRDSDAEGRDIERLTVELAAPERVGLQQGIWPQRERRQRASEATSERFPLAPRQLTWNDPHAQAGDLAWRWLAHSVDPPREPLALEGSPGSSQAAAAAGRQAARRAVRATAVSTAAFQVAGETAAVPLFSGFPTDSRASPPQELVIRQPPDAPASYADLLFMPHTDTQHDKSGSRVGQAVDQADAEHTSDQLLLFSPRSRQHYTEPFIQEDRHAPTVDTRNCDSRQPTTDRSGVVQPPDQAAA